MRLAAFLPLALLLLAGASDRPTWTLTLKSVGPVAIESSVSEFRSALGRQLAPGQIASDCGSASTRDGDLFFYTRDGHVALATVYQGRTRTRSGIGIGSTERDLRQTYDGYLTRRAGGEGIGSEYVYTPRDRADQRFRIVFSVDQGRVTSMTVGTLPDILERGEASRCFRG